MKTIEQTIIHIELLSKMKNLECEIWIEALDFCIKKYYHFSIGYIENEYNVRKRRDGLYNKMWTNALKWFLEVD